ncbi:hypothetical protein ACNQR7_30985 [Mycolicibacterium senegalense]|uniref:hypothetical protein n=1 Tax=Mycolicibacterium senegalense TaxID=1796 RepID=UPI003AACDC10
MSQADENYPTATPKPPQPPNPPLLQPALNPPPSCIPKRGAGLYPYPTQPSQPTVQVAMYSGAAPVKNPGAAAVLAALFGATRKYCSRRWWRCRGTALRCGPADR